MRFQAYKLFFPFIDLVPNLLATRDDGYEGQWNTNIMSLAAYVLVREAWITVRALG